MLTVSDLDAVSLHNTPGDKSIARKRAERLVASIELEMRNSPSSPIPKTFPVAKYSHQASPPSSPPSPSSSQINTKRDELIHNLRRELHAARSEKQNLDEQLRATEAELARSQEALANSRAQQEHASAVQGEGALCLQIQQLEEELSSERLAASRQERDTEEEKLQLTRQVRHPHAATPCTTLMLLPCIHFHTTLREGTPPGGSGAGAGGAAHLRPGMVPPLGARGGEAPPEHSGARGRIRHHACEGGPRRGRAHTGSSLARSPRPPSRRGQGAVCGSGDGEG